MIPTPKALPGKSVCINYFRVSLLIEMLTSFHSEFNVFWKIYDLYNSQEFELKEKKIVNTFVQCSSFIKRLYATQLFPTSCNLKMKILYC